MKLVTVIHLIIFTLLLIQIESKTKLKQNPKKLMKVKRDDPDAVDQEAISDFPEDLEIRGNCFVKMNGWFYNLYGMNLSGDQYIIL